MSLHSYTFSSPTKVKWGQGRGNGETFWIKKNQNCVCAEWCVKQHLEHSKYSKCVSKEGRQGRREGKRMGRLCVKPSVPSGSRSQKSQNSKSVSSLPPECPHTIYWTSLSLRSLIWKMGRLCLSYSETKVSNSYLYQPHCHHHFHYILHPSIPFNFILKTNLFQTISGRLLLLMCPKQRTKDFLISISAPLIFSNAHQPPIAWWTTHTTGDVPFQYSPA